MTACAHCGSEVGAGSPAGPDFCCLGCQSAHALLKDLGLESYYRRRGHERGRRPLRPDEDGNRLDYAPFAQPDGKGIQALHLTVEGMQSPACAWLIKRMLARQPGVVGVRLDRTAEHLSLCWREDQNDANALLAPLVTIGFSFVPFDPKKRGEDIERRQRGLLRALIIAGFATAAVMLFSLSIWAGEDGDMDHGTRALYHWLSALIALPAAMFCVRPLACLSARSDTIWNAGLDLAPTGASFAILAISFWETVKGGPGVHFDAALLLLFFLLAIHFLAGFASRPARSAAELLRILNSRAVTVIENGARRLLPPDRVTAGMTVLVAAGERIGVDGNIVDGCSDVDASPITGDPSPTVVFAGSTVFAGSLNLLAPVLIRVARTGGETLLAEIARVMETAGRGHARQAAVARLAARCYPLAASVAALAAFLGWVGFADASWREAFLVAVSLLIVACPGALVLTVPTAQMVALGRLAKKGVLLKSETGGERLAKVDTIIFDKTGALTLGRPELIDPSTIKEGDRRLAASIATTSAHPVARAVARAVPDAVPAEGTSEHVGSGLEWGGYRLGSRRWLDLPEEPGQAQGPELFLVRPGQKPARFAFSDKLRPDAAETVEELGRLGYDVALLSGDRAPTVSRVARAAGIKRWLSDLAPGEKSARLTELGTLGRKVLVVADGINDAPFLAAAHVSMSPALAADIGRITADVVFQGERLDAVLETLSLAKRVDAMARRNMVLAMAYHLVTVPVAALGMMSPLAAVAIMAAPSLAVIAGALRLSFGKP